MTEFEKAARLMNETGLGEHGVTPPALPESDEDSDPPGPWNWADAPTTGFIA